MTEAELQSPPFSMTRPASAGTPSAPPAWPAPAAAAPVDEPFPEMTTRRLRLREITQEDAADLLAIHGDVTVMRWFGSNVLPDLGAARRLVSFFASCRRLATGTRWGIERKEDGRLLGTCGFHSWDRNYRRCNLGYELGTFAWRKGYMQEALAAVLPWGYFRMRLHRIEAHIHPANTASIQLAKGFGFVQEGLLRELEFWDDRPQDMLLFSLLQRDMKWPERKESSILNYRWLQRTAYRIESMLLRGR